MAISMEFIKHQPIVQMDFLWNTCFPLETLIISIVFSQKIFSMSGRVFSRAKVNFGESELLVVEDTRGSRDDVQVAFISRYTIHEGTPQVLDDQGLVLK